MAAPAAVLAIMVEANASQATSTLNKVQGALQQTGKRAQETSKHTGRLGGALRSAARYAAGAATAYIGIAAAKNAVTTTEDLAKTTLTLHKSFGLGIKSASEWAAVLRARGADSKSVGMAFKTLATNVSAALGGSKSATKGFQQLGISMADLRKGNTNPEGLLAKISDGVKKMGPSLTAGSAAAKLFGRGWQAIAPVLRSGSEAMREQLAAANKAGATFGGKSLKSMEDFAKSQREMKLTTMGLQIAFTTFLAPALTKAMQAFGRFIAQMKTGKGFGGDVAAAFRHAAGVVKSLAGFFSALPGPVRRAGIELAIFGIAAKKLGLGGLIAGFGRLVGILPKVATAEREIAAGATLMTGPLAAFLAAGAALGLGIDHLVTGGKNLSQTLARSYTDTFNNKVVPAFKSADAAQRAFTITSIQNAAKAGTISREVADAWVKSLNRIDKAQRTAASAPFSFANKLRSQGKVTVGAVVDLIKSLKKLPPAAQVQGAATAVALAKALERSGQIPVGSARAIAQAITQALNIKPPNLTPVQTEFAKLQHTFDRFQHTDFSKAIRGLDLGKLSGNVKVGAKADTASAQKAGNAVKKAAGGKATINVGVGGNAASQARRTQAQVRGIIARSIGFVLRIPNMSGKASGTWNTIAHVLARLVTTPVATRDLNSRQVHSSIAGVFGGVITQVINVVKHFLFASGTGSEGTPDGPVIAGEEGRELAIYPSGRKRMLRGPRMYDLPQGTEILSNKDTEAWLRAGVPGFASGTGKTAQQRAMFRWKPYRRLRSALSSATTRFLDLDEQIDIATRVAALPGGPSGTDLSGVFTAALAGNDRGGWDGERGRLIKLNSTLQTALVTKLTGILTKIAAVNKRPPSKTQPGGNAPRLALVKSAWEMVKTIVGPNVKYRDAANLSAINLGYTGYGGRLFDVYERLTQLMNPTGEDDTSGTGVPDQSALLELLRTQLSQSQLALGVSQAQYDVFRDMPQYGGQFAKGGIVPGPAGVPRTVIAHGGEMFGGQGGIRVIVHGDVVSDRRDPIEVILGDRRFHAAVEKSNRRQSRSGNRPLPGGSRV